MVSRQTTRPLRKLVPAVAIGASALLGIVGCGAGQVAQTAEMPPAVNGNSGHAGDVMLRNVLVAFPESGEPYERGDEAPLLLSIVNTGTEDAELVGASSPAGEIEMIGNPVIPAGTALRVVLPDENPSAAETTTTTTTTTDSAPSSETSGTESPESSESSATTTEPPSETEAVSPPVVGTMSLVLNLTTALPFGKNVPVTFEFADSGKVTIELPVGAPATPRPEAEAVEEEH